MALISRRAMIRGCVALGTIAAFGDASWVEPRYLRMCTHRVPIRNVPRCWHCRILHIADLHYDTDMPLEFLREALALGLSANPDLIAITGDFVHSRLPERAQFARFLKEIAAAKPALATMGNHDGGDWAHRFGGGYKDSSLVRTLIEESGITMLHNRSTALEIGGHPLRLVGLGDSWSGEVDRVSAFGGVNKEEAVVLLSHNPDSKSGVGDYSWELMLSGHTHGGQVRIPFVGGAPFAPVRDKRYVTGLNSWRDRWVHTTQGIATTGGIRFNCRPEVSILDLVAV